MSKHTPGPWVISKKDALEKGHVAINAESHVALAKVVWVMDGDEYVDRNSPECEANARLIAAAPELLDALKHVLNSGRGISGRVILEAEDEDIARAAIAKATGEAQ